MSDDGSEVADNDAMYPDAPEGGVTTQPKEPEAPEDVIRDFFSNRDADKPAPDAGTKEPLDDWFTTDLQDRADAAGFSREEALALGQQSLKTVLTALDRRAPADAHSRMAPPPDPRNPADDQGQQGGDPKKSAKFDLKLDPNAYDEGIIKAMEGMNEHYANQVAEIRQQVLGVNGHIAAQAAKDFESGMDRNFSSLGEEYQTVFGKGPMRTMQVNSSVARARNEVVLMMDSIATSAKQRGLRVPSDEELFKRAVHAVSPDIADRIARKKLAGNLDKRNGQMATRASTSRAPARGSGDQGLAAVRDKMQDLGILD
jgi:hypothetical protein